MKGAFRFPMIKVEGGGGESPDPAVFCPANGFIPDPEIIQIPIPIPELSEDSVIFICNTENGGSWPLNDWITFSAVSTEFTFEVYDSIATLVYSITINSGAVELDSVISGLYGRFSVKVSGTGIAGFQRSGSYFSNPIVDYIIANIPSVVAMGSACRAMPNLKAFEFRCSLDYLENLDYSFYESSVEYFTFPNSLPALTSASFCFGMGKLRKLDLSTVSMPLLEDIDRFVFYNPYLLEFKMPSELPSLKNATQLIDNTPRLITLQIFSTWPVNLTSHSNMLSYSGFESDIEVPDIPDSIPYLSRIFYYSTMCKKIVFNAGHEGLNLDSTMYGMSSLEYVKMPDTTDNFNTVFDSAVTKVKTFIGPTKGYVSIPNSAVLESVTGDMETDYASIYINLTSPQNTLHTFNCPKVPVRYFRIGGYNSYQHFSQLHSVEIDWANSSFDYTSSITNPSIRINAELDSAELNRIMTALPTVTLLRHIDIRYCPGYATCDKSIATAKGWTVL